ncbi:MAG: MMPL family transporter, partial [Steroidobacteraceae bacterium]
MLLLFAGILAVAGAGIYKLKIDFNFLHEFKPHIEWRQHTQYINDNMGGLLSVVYLFDTGTPDGVKDVELLREIEGLQQVAESQAVAQDSVSVVDIVKELNQAFHGGDPAYYRLPEDRDTLSQLLLVYELSGGKEMNDVLNLDRSKTALQIRLKLVAASEVRAFMEKLNHYLEAHPLATAKVEISGIGYLWVQIAQYISDTQIQGYTLTFALIMVTMMLAFGSVRLGALAMVPNVFPIAVVLGCMGWLDWHLDYLRLLFATIAIGIAVDDTIHFTSCYKREFEHCGRYREALERTMSQVGPAMVSMTMILIVALSAYYASSLAVIASFGFLLTLTIAVAAISDLLLMPALLLWLKPFGAERAVETELVAQGATVTT